MTLGTQEFPVGEAPEKKIMIIMGHGDFANYDYFDINFIPPEAPLC